jgi:hypothetical protein
MEDLPLNRPTPRLHEPAPPRQASPVQWVIVAIGGVVVGAGLTFWWMSRTQPAPPPPPSAVPTDVNAATNRPKRQLLDLPSLADSDAFLQSLVSALSQHPTLTRFLATKGLVRASTLAVVQIGDGRTPAAPLIALRPATRAQITGSTSGSVPTANMARWDHAAAALASVSPADAAQVYVNVKPLVDEAYIELGHADGNFDAAIVRAVEMLASAPALDAPPVLLKRPGYFEYEDPELRSLKPVQKQFLLMGAENRRRILTWLRDLARHLDLTIR